MELLSAGIDIGTTTTRVALSRITITDTAGAFRLPEYRIVQKELLYLGRAHFTPRRGDEVDGAALGALIEEEYARAGVQSEQIGTGAVILTGEAARCRNAPEVTESLARLAGGFVVAAAGADMEGVLAAKGSGAAALSVGGYVLHTDIGGGTSNLCLLKNGEPVDTGCLDIGGRLIRYDSRTRRVEYVSPVLDRLRLNIAEGEFLSPEREDEFATLLADVLAQALGRKERTWQYDALLADHGIALPPDGCALTFSGGVGELLYYQSDGTTVLEFGDIGPALARAVAAHPLIPFSLRPPNTGSATVMGAADFSLSLSGSTVYAVDWAFPLKGLQAVFVRLSCREDIARLPDVLLTVAKRYGSGSALVLGGFAGAGFRDVEAIADGLAHGIDGDLIVIVKENMAKALGQALSRRTNRRVLCLDGLDAKDGDFIDIGRPVGGVFPVVIHTLLFGR